MEKDIAVVGVDCDADGCYWSIHLFLATIVIYISFSYVSLSLYIYIYVGIPVSRVFTGATRLSRRPME
jgi:hypothetical protein